MMQCYARICKINKYWQYMIGKISKPTSFSKADTQLKETYKEKLMKWLLIIDSFYGVIRTTYTIDLISYIRILELAFEI